MLEESFVISLKHWLQRTKALDGAFAPSNEYRDGFGRLWYRLRSFTRLLDQHGLVGIPRLGWRNELGHSNAGQALSF